MMKAHVNKGLLHMIDDSGWLKDAKAVLRGQDVKMGAIGA
jgi:hypothetical protein